MVILEPIRKTINYVAELYRNINYLPIYATAPNNFDRQYNIFAFSAAPIITDPTNYWIVWGGYFDNPATSDVAILMDTFLTEVFTTAQLQAVQNSYYIDHINFIVYINIFYRPWQYKPEKTGVFSDNETTFASAPKNHENYSDQMYGTKKVSVRLAVPSISMRLSNVFLGDFFYNSFSFTLLNNDKYFDDIDIKQFFNTFASLKKDSMGSVSTDDFNLIRRGLVYNITKNFENITVDCIDQLYQRTNQVCKKLTLSDYPNLPDANISKDLPLAWGTIYKAPLIQIDIDPAPTPLWIKYLVIERNHIVSIDNVFDKDQKILAHTFDAFSGIITVTQLDANGRVIDGVSADITASSSNKLGQILTEIICPVENLPFVEGIWDIVETTSYISISPSLGFYFAGGSSKTFLEQLLKNDMCYLILKNDNRLTIRKWGENYNESTIPSWLIMGKPSVNYSDANTYYMSSVKLQYRKNQLTGVYTKTYINDTQELAIFNKYKKSRTGFFYVDILDSALLLNFSNLLLNRFGEIKDTITIAVGVDTYQINLLDKINLILEINGRVMSSYTQWVVKEINPSQDILVLEGII